MNANIIYCCYKTNQSRIALVAKEFCFYTTSVDRNMGWSSISFCSRVASSKSITITDCLFRFAGLIGILPIAIKEMSGLNVVHNAVGLTNSGSPAAALIDKTQEQLAQYFEIRLQMEATGRNRYVAGFVVIMYNVGAFYVVQKLRGSWCVEHSKFGFTPRWSRELSVQRRREQAGKEIELNIPHFLQSA